MDVNWFIAIPVGIITGITVIVMLERWFGKDRDGGEW